MLNVNNNKTLKVEYIYCYSFGDIHLHGGPEHNLVSFPDPSHLLSPRDLLVLISFPLSHVAEQVDHAVQSSQPKIH